MLHLTKKLLTLATFVVLSFAVAPATYADVFNEVGDAPETLPGQSATGGTNPLTAINGTIGSTTDADLFRIFIMGGAFSATTVGTGGTLADTQLFLFTSSGIGITGNDDSVGVRSTITLAGLAPGEYLLAITGFNRDPVSAGGLIFTNNFTGPQTPTGPGGGQPLTGFLGTSGTGTYTINLTGASFVQGGGTAVPEPATMILLGTGLAGVVAKVRRRKE